MGGKVKVIATAAALVVASDFIVGSFIAPRVAASPTLTPYGKYIDVGLRALVVGVGVAYLAK